MKIGLSKELVKFLTSPLFISEGWEDLAALSEFGNTELGMLFQSAIENNLLPDSVLLAQYIHINPADLRIDFDIPTVVNRKIMNKVLSASIFHGNFVKNTGISFFQNAIRKHKGLVCVISDSSKTPNLNLDYPAFSQITIDHTDQINPLFLEWINSKNIKKKRLGETKWDSISGIDMSTLFDIHPPRLEVSDSIRPNIPSEFEDLFFPNPIGYFKHISPLVSLGSIVLCVPVVYLSEVGSSAISSGGLFVLKGKINEQTILLLYMFTYKLSSVFLGIYDVAQAISRKETIKNTQMIAVAMAHTFRHEYNNTNEIVQNKFKTLLDSKELLKQDTYDDICGRLNLMSLSIEGLEDLFNVTEKESLQLVTESILKEIHKWQDFFVNIEGYFNYSVSTSFKLVLAELLRNAYERNPTYLKKIGRREAQIRFGGNNNFYIIEIQNPTDADESIIERLNYIKSTDIYNPKENKHRGIPLCKFIVEHLNGQLVFEYSEKIFKAIINLPKKVE